MTKCNMSKQPVCSAPEFWRCLCDRPTAAASPQVPAQVRTPLPLHTQC